MQIERANLKNRIVNSLPDGSKVIVDSKGEQVFALNATAGAAWDACNESTTLSKLAQDMQRILHSWVSNDVAEEAIVCLQEKELVTIWGSSPKSSRRQAMATLGTLALPLVVSVTMGEQRAYAQFARSGDVPHSRRPQPHEPTEPRDERFGR
jgi:hypothetical protein